MESEIEKEEVVGVLQVEKKKITFRPLNYPADLDAVAVWACDDKVSQFCSWETHTSMEAVDDYFRNKLLSFNHMLAICVDDDSPPIGNISIVIQDECRGEIGYVIASEYWGKGIATEAVKAMVEIGFAELGLERIEGLVDVENLGSERVLEKVGFAKEGVLRSYEIRKGKVRDLAIFNILANEISHVEIFTNVGGQRLKLKSYRSLS